MNWLDLVASEKMDSSGAAHTITQSCSLIQEIIGKPETVLCVGCGSGYELNMWSNAEGIDLNDVSLQKCRNQGFIVYKEDMHKMSFKDNSYELVYSRDVFEHAISPIEAISEMARVSSKYVAIVLPDESWQWSKWHFIIPTIRQMISLGEKANLMLKSMREYNINLGTTNIQQSLYLFQI